MEILFSRNVVFVFAAFLITLSFLIIQTVKQTNFYLKSNAVASKVVSVLANNELSARGKNGRKPQTRFHTTFEYIVNKNKFQLHHEITKKGYNYPKDQFQYAIGDEKLLKYDPGNPGKSHFASPFAIFIIPIVLFVFTMIFGIATLRNIRDLKMDKT